MLCGSRLQEAGPPGFCASPAQAPLPAGYGCTKTGGPCFQAMTPDPWVSLCPSDPHEGDSRALRHSQSPGRLFCVLPTSLLPPPAFSQHRTEKCRRIPLSHRHLGQRRTDSPSPIAPGPKHNLHLSEDFRSMTLSIQQGTAIHPGHSGTVPGTVVYIQQQIRRGLCVQGMAEVQKVLNAIHKRSLGEAECDRT